MMSVSSPKIGASVVDAIMRGMDSNNDRHTLPSAGANVSVDAFSKPRSSSSPSILESILLDDDVSSPPQERPRRIILQGPPRSGQTSVLFQLAYRLAEQTPCYCRTAISSSSYCRCTAVLLFRPALTTTTTTTNDDDDHDCCSLFPLECQELEQESDFASQWKRLQDERSSSDNSSSTTAGWNKDILKRIQVYHVTHVRDVYKHLLQLQGQEQPPWGGILVDSIDEILKVGDHGGPTTTTTAVTSPSAPPLLRPQSQSQPAILGLSQLLAVLVDTANCLQRMHGGASRMPTVAMTTLQEDVNLLAKVVRFCSPLVLQVKPSSSNSNQQSSCFWHHPDKQKEDRQEVVISSWSVSRVVDRHRHDKKQVGCHAGPAAPVVHYAILRSIDQDLRIVWRRDNKDNGPGQGMNDGNI